MDLLNSLTNSILNLNVFPRASFILCSITNNSKKFHNKYNVLNQMEILEHDRYLSMTKRSITQDERMEPVVMEYNKYLPLLYKFTIIISRHKKVCKIKRIEYLNGKLEFHRTDGPALEINYRRLGHFHVCYFYLINNIPMNINGPTYSEHKDNVPQTVYYTEMKRDKPVICKKFGNEVYDDRIYIVEDVEEGNKRRKLKVMRWFISLSERVSNIGSYTPCSLGVTED